MADHLLQEEDYSSKLDLSVWKKVLKYAFVYKRQMIILMVMMAVLAGIDSLANVFVKGVIDSATAGKGQMIVIIGIIWFAMCLANVTIVYVFIVFAGKCSTHISHDIRRDAFERLQELDPAYFDHKPVGWLMARLTSDCQRLSGMLAWGMVDLVWGFTMMASVAAVMLAINWKLALIVLSVVPLLAYATRRFKTAILQTSRAIRKANSLITASFNEGIMGVRTTKTLVRQEQNLAEFQGLSGEMYLQSIRNAVQTSMFMPIVMTIGAIGTGFALWIGGAEALAGAIGLGTLVLFINCAGQFFFPIQELASLFSQLQAVQASAERVMGLLDTHPAIKDSPEIKSAIDNCKKTATADSARNDSSTSRACNLGLRSFSEAGLLHAGSASPSSLAEDGLPDAIGRIEFKDVSFWYMEGQRVLENFSLTVEPGKTVALVGHTGGGKTTIVSLLCRFYEPTAGQILLDGRDYRQRSLHWLQSSLGIVLQTPHLFSGTVRENIRYGRLDATDEQIEQAARLVNAHDFIMKMEKGYDSPAGQGGNRLSTGQKQLVALARAILADPKIFIMDEATSSVDTETEKLIQAAIEKVLRGRTSFVIAHRLSTIRSADLILLVENGRIVERGSHHQLICAGGRYHELYTGQFTAERQEKILAQDAG